MFTEESLLLTLQYIAYIFLLPPVVILVLDRITGYLAKDVFGVYQATGIVGTPIHELAHASACLLFGMRIVEMKLYKPNRETGQLGYVNFAYRPGSTFHAVGLVIQGIAPLLMAYAIFILVIPWGRAPETLLHAFELTDASPTYQHAIAGASALLIGNLMDGARGFLWFLIAMIIGLHAMPSWADIRIAFKGMCTLLAVAIGFSALSQIDISFLPPGIQDAISVILGLILKGFFWMLEQLTYAVTLVTAVAVVSIFTFMFIPAMVVKCYRLVTGKPAPVHASAPAQGPVMGGIPVDPGAAALQALGAMVLAQQGQVGRPEHGGMHVSHSGLVPGQTSAIQSKGDSNLTGRNH